MLRQGLLGPSPKGIHDHIETGQIVPSQIEQVLLQHLLGDGAVFLPHHGGHVQASFHSFLHNFLPSFSIGTHNCKFHKEFLLKCDEILQALDRPYSSALACSILPLVSIIK